MIRDLVQTALDTALNPSVLVHWQRKTGPDADEYVVYTLGGDSNEEHADDIPLVAAADVTVRYYYRAEKLDTPAGRQSVKSRESTIETALKGAGFTLPNGYFDAGDIDDIGFYVTAFPCEYWRVV
jgi:hypothetical protein